MSVNVSHLDPNFREWCEVWVDALAYAGLAPRITSTRRSQSEQAALYQKYLSGGSRYPAAKPGHSLHEWGLAFDLGLDERTLSVIGPIWESLGMVWGGRFKDPIHFEAGPEIKRQVGYSSKVDYWVKEAERGGAQQTGSPIDWALPVKWWTAFIPLPRV